MNFEPAKRTFGWPWRAAVATFACLFLPMAPGIMQSGLGDTQPAPLTGSPTYPVVVKSIPAIGAIDVDPALNQISVTFDRDMGKGMSWTGGPPLFPPIDKNGKPHWVDSRTCVLPVTLEKASYYRVGINAQSFQNFRSKDGVPAPSTVICFVTKGATADVQSRVRVPQIVSSDPKNGADHVDPKIMGLSVTFDIPMQAGGMSWCTGEGDFPTIPDGKRATWSNGGLTCTLPVALEPGHAYVLNLNDVRFNNFQSRWGVPLVPVVYKFQTQGK